MVCIAIKRDPSMQMHIWRCHVPSSEVTIYLFLIEVVVAFSLFLRAKLAATHNSWVQIEGVFMFLDLDRNVNSLSEDPAQLGTYKIWHFCRLKRRRLRR